ncbi:VOC family protein [Actinomadura luteofluorescens]|uniref:VOC family protein n=1 Tax=Actinomadura luteofluorescens TaxID=46163 RepID=UPI003D8D5F28
MPDITEYPPGWPAWIELASPDVEGSKEFYCELFGWGVYDVTIPGLTDLSMFTLGDLGPEVLGMQPLADSAQYPSWLCYFRAGDLQTTGQAVADAGGQVLSDLIDVADLEQLAMFGDREGADFAVVQPRRLHGAAVIDEPSAVCWVELACRRPGQARTFYEQVFGWQAVERRFRDRPVTAWKAGGHVVASMIEMDDSFPTGYPPHWFPWIWVEDCDATVSRAAELGASIRFGPTDEEQVAKGRMAFMTDPAGARFAVITPHGDWMGNRLNSMPHHPPPENNRKWWQKPPSLRSRLRR